MFTTDEFNDTLGKHPPEIPHEKCKKPSDAINNNTSNKLITPLNNQQNNTHCDIDKYQKENPSHCMNRHSHGGKGDLLKINFPTIISVRFTNIF